MTNQEIKNSILDVVNSISYEPLTISELKDKVDSDGLIDNNTFNECINELIKEFDIFYNNKKTRIIQSRKANKYKGIISIKNDKFGFIKNDFYDDFFVPSYLFNGALDKDLCLYEVLEDRLGESGFKASIIKVLKRGNEYLVGTVDFYNNEYILIPSDKNITKKVILRSDTCKLHKDDIVRCKIISVNGVIKCNVTEVLGSTKDFLSEITLVLAKHNRDFSFSNDVLEEVNNINVDFDKEKARRTLYKERIYTIDSLKAKDLDDAISIEKLDNGNYKLNVYIADVSFYVKKDSLLDIEALNRGCSSYLLNRVVPMLPVRLSNDLCSLNPNEDKLVICCEMEINKYGEVIDYKLTEACIATTKRLCYEYSNDVIENGTINHPDYEVCYNDLLLMKELYEILHNKRVKRGAIDFDTIELDYILDKDGKCCDLKPIERGVSERIIEEFMIVANETVSYYMSTLDMPFIYRCHDKPDNIKYQELKSMVGKLGYHMKGLNPMEFQKLLNYIGDDMEFLKNSIIRLMSKAVYTNDNIGHFGLASSYYTHFTSPIRRYPDLLVHRLIREYIFNNHLLLTQEEIDIKNDEIYRIANISNDCEKKAMDCEFEIQDMKKAEYMVKYIGCEFEGIVTSVHKFGIFVILESNCEGLVSSNNLKDNYYTYNNTNNTFIDSKMNKKIVLGSSVKIRVVNSNKETGDIDFELVGKKGVKNGSHKNSYKKQKHIS